MAFSYGGFVNSGVGKFLASNLGLPRPTRLRRHTPGESLVPGAVFVDGFGEAPLAAQVRGVLEGAGVQLATVPSTSVNSPFTFDRPKCLTAKPAWVWLRSMT